MKDITTFEDLLGSLGGFGLFQIVVLIAIYYPEIPAGTIAILPVYVGARPDNISCIFEGAEITVNEFTNDSCICQESVGGQHETIVSEWLLVCNKSWVSDFITSIQMVGFLLGGIVGSQISDWIGRKKSFYLSCGLFGVSALASAFAPGPIYYAIARFLVGFGISAYLAIANIYAIEFLPASQRSLVGAVGPWGEGIMLIALFAYYFRPWRLLSIVTSIPVLLTFFTLPFLPESPRWLLQRGRTEEAIEVFKKIERWNKRGGCCKKPPSELLESTEASIDYKSTLEVIGGQCTRTSLAPEGRGQIFRVGFLRKKLLLFVGSWFSISIIYNGLSFNVKNLEGDPYLNLVFTGGVNSLACATSAYFNQKLGRKLAIMIYMSLSCASLLSIVLDLGPLGNDPMFALVMSLSGQFFNSGAWSAIKCFTAESFPTSVRSNAIGICSFSAALAGVIAPQIVFLGSHYVKAAPFYAFGGLGLLSIFLTFFLEETKGKPINESLESIAPTQC